MHLIESMYASVLKEIVIYSIPCISEVSIEMFNRKGSILTKNNLAFEAKQEKIKISKSNYYNTKKKYLYMFDSNYTLHMFLPRIKSYLKKLEYICSFFYDYANALREFTDQTELISALLQNYGDIYDLIELSMKESMLHYDMSFEGFFTYLDENIITTEYEKLKNYVCTQSNCLTQNRYFRILNDTVNLIPEKEIYTDFSLFHENLINYNFQSKVFKEELEKINTLNHVARTSYDTINKTVTDFTNLNMFITLILCLCEAREYYQNGYSEIFSEDCLGNEYRLINLLKIPVINNVSIEKSGYIEKNYLKSMNNNLSDFINNNFLTYLSNKDVHKKNVDISQLVVESDHVFKFHFESSLLYELNDLCLYITGRRENNDISNNQSITDLSSGFEFEQYIANLLRKIGYSDVTITKSTGDYGVDVVATKDLVTYAFQCKYYSQPVGNKAIQEVFTGKNYYHAHIGVIVTNNTFTQSAINQAKSVGIILWDGSYLNKLIHENNIDNFDNKPKEKSSIQKYPVEKIEDSQFSQYNDKKDNVIYLKHVKQIKYFTDEGEYKREEPDANRIIVIRLKTLGVYTNIQIGYTYTDLNDYSCFYTLHDIENYYVYDRAKFTYLIDKSKVIFKQRLIDDIDKPFKYISIELLEDHYIDDLSLNALKIFLE